MPRKPFKEECSLSSWFQKGVNLSLDAFCMFMVKCNIVHYKLHTIRYIEACLAKQPRLINNFPLLTVFLFFIFILYFIVYVNTFVIILPSLPPSTQHLPTPSGNPPTIVPVHGRAYVFWLLYSLCGTLHSHEYSVTTNLYFLSPSPFLPFPLTPLPSGDHLCIYDSKQPQFKTD